MRLEHSPPRGYAKYTTIDIALIEQVAEKNSHLKISQQVKIRTQKSTASSIGKTVYSEYDRAPHTPTASHKYISVLRSATAHPSIVLNRDQVLVDCPAGYESIVSVNRDHVTAVPLRKQMS